MGAVVRLHACDARGGKRAFPCVGALLREEGFEHTTELRVVVSADLARAEPRVLREPCLAEGVAEASEVSVAGRGDEDPTVPSLIEPVERVQSVQPGVGQDPWRPARIVDEMSRQRVGVRSHHPRLGRLAVP